MRGRFGNEEGFTLPEMMVTISVMLVIFFALYTIFDASVRIFDFGNDKVEAVENARLGLERMEREARAAYPYDKGNALGGGIDTRLLGTMAANEIVFGNDLNGNNAVDASETVKYRLSGSGTTRTLQRSQPSTGTPQDVVEYVLPPSAGAPYPGAPAPYPGGLRFFYLGDGGSTATSEAQVKVVRIELDVSKDGRVQTLSTDVALRNRGE